MLGKIPKNNIDAYVQGIKDSLRVLKLLQDKRRKNGVWDSDVAEKLKMDFINVKTVMIQLHKYKFTKYKNE